MKTVVVRPAEPVDPGVADEIAATFAECFTLAHLMRWAERQAPPARIAEIVTQDEYTHDVILPFGSFFLSFDTT